MVTYDFRPQPYFSLELLLSLTLLVLLTIFGHFLKNAFS
jgi:hypothetical protein